MPGLDIIVYGAPTMALVPEPWALFLLGLILLAILGVGLYGTGAGLAGVLSVSKRQWPRSAAVRPTGGGVVRYGWHALIAGAIDLAVLATISVGLKGDLRFLLIAEPALLLGVAAIVLGWPSAGSGFRVLDLMGLVAWIGLAIARRWS